MVKLSPPDKTTQFFGLYAFAGKSTAWLVPGLMTLILALTNSLQLAMISIVAFNLIGIIGMFFVYDESSAK